MSEYQKLKTAYEAKVKTLQDSCPHPTPSKWYNYAADWRTRPTWQIKVCKRCDKYVLWRHKCDWCGEWVEMSHETEREVYCAGDGMQDNTPPYKVAINWVICSVQCCREKRLITGIINYWNEKFRKAINREINRGGSRDFRQMISCADDVINREMVVKILGTRPTLKDLVRRITEKTGAIELLKLIESGGE